MEPRLSIVIVAYNESESLRRGLPPLVRELDPGDEIIVSDNASTDGTGDVTRELAPGAVIVRRATNGGFPAACNDGVAAAGGDIVVLLNPDAVVAPGFRDAILRPVREAQPWDAWMGLVTMDGGSRINTSGGVIHFTGLSWAGQVGAPAAQAPAEPREVPFVSGACLAIPLATWRQLGGMPGEFFLYFDDVDLSLRLRLAGGRVGIDPRIRVDHTYEFSKGQRKWRMLERNRWATILRCYPAALLLLLAPGLVASELGILAAAISGGWLGPKLLATWDTAVRLSRLLRERREIQRTRTVSVAHFAAALTPDLSSPYLGRAASSRALRIGLRAYWRIVMAVLRGAKL